MKIALTKLQYRALNELRGLPADAHMLVMTARQTESGGVMEGSKETLDEFVSFISEELDEGMLSARTVRSLIELCVTIDAECADWLAQ